MNGRLLEVGDVDGVDVENREEMEDEGPAEDGDVEVLKDGRMDLMSSSGDLATSCRQKSGWTDRVISFDGELS